MCNIILIPDISTLFTTTLIGCEAYCVCMNWRAWPVGTILMRVSPILERYSLKLYGHLLNMDTSLLKTVLLCPCGKRALTFSLNSTDPLNTDTTYIQTLSMAPSVSLLMEFDCICQTKYCLQATPGKRFCLRLPP